MLKLELPKTKSGRWTWRLLRETKQKVQVVAMTPLDWATKHGALRAFRTLMANIWSRSIDGEIEK